MRNGGNAPMSRPSKRIEPAVAGVRPMIERTVVVLPMPFRPIRVTISPADTASDMPNSTWLSPYRVSMASTARRCSAMSNLLFAKIRAANLGVGADFSGFTRGDDAAIDQHGDAIGEREHRLHVVLDQEDRQLALELAQNADHSRGFVR